MVSICFLLSFYVAGLAQNSVEFIVVDENKSPISYANVFAKESKKGAFSRLNGEVKFVDIPKTDTLAISCVGYQKKWVSVSQIGDTVVLATSTKKLEEVKIKANYEQKEVGISRKRFLISHTEGRFGGSINGIVFPNKTQIWIENVSIYIQKPEDSSRNQFRLMIYKVDDSTSFPTEPILTKKLFFEVSEKGWSTIHLDTLNLWVSGNYFVGIETVPDYSFRDAANIFKWTSQPTAQYKCISYLFKERDLIWVWGYSGDSYFYGLDGTNEGANDNFPLIKAEIKY